VSSKFFIRLTILAILLLAVTYALQQIPGVNFIDVFAYSSIAFFYFLTLLIILIIGRAVSRTNNRQFVSMITAAIGIKIFASIIFVLAFAFIHMPQSILIVLPFFLYYAALTIIEVAEMLKLNKLASQQPQDTRPKTQD